MNFRRAEDSEIGYSLTFEAEGIELSESGEEALAQALVLLGTIMTSIRTFHTEKFRNAFALNILEGMQGMASALAQVREHYSEHEVDKHASTLQDEVLRLLKEIEEDRTGG